MATVAALIALLAFAGQAVPAASSPVADELALSKTALSSLLGGSGEHCKAFCEGQPIEGMNNECWGLLKVWCGPPPPAPGQETEHELSGLICQGHWRSLAVDVPAPSGGAPQPSLVTVCEGGHKWIALKTSTCPHTGHTTKKMMGVMSAGEIINVMSVSGPQAALVSQHVTASSTQQGEAKVREVLQALERAHLPNSAASSATTKSGLAATHTFSIESKHHGLKVEWQAHKRVPPSSSPVEQQTWQSLEDEVDELLAPSWRDWMPSAGGPPTHPGNGSFELLCNGKPAWLHGAVPCWGNFTIAAKHASSPPSTSSTSSSATSAHGSGQPCKTKMKTGGMLHEKLSLRRLLATPMHLVAAADSSTTAHAMEQPRATSSATAADRPAVRATLNHTLSMKAECDGLWTGALGHTCHGVSTSHLEVTTTAVQGPGQALPQGKIASSAAAADAAGNDEDEDDDDDDEDEDVPSLSKWTICTGHQHIQFIKRDGTFGMAVACKGGSSVSLNMTLPARPDE